MKIRDKRNIGKKNKTFLVSSVLSSVFSLMQVLFHGQGFQFHDSQLILISLDHESRLI